MVDGALQIRPPPDLAPLGEADIKFTRYGEICRDLLVDSVDGDSIPIALIHQELAFSDLPGGTMRSEDLAGSPLRICIRRITTRSTRPPRKKPRRARKHPSQPAKRTSPSSTSTSRSRSCVPAAPLPRAAGHPPAVHGAPAFQALHVHAAGAHRPPWHQLHQQHAPGVRLDALQPPASAGPHLLPGGGRQLPAQCSDSATPTSSTACSTFKFELIESESGYQTRPEAVTVVNLSACLQCWPGPSGDQLLTLAMQRFRV